MTNFQLTDIELTECWRTAYEAFCSAKISSDDRNLQNVFTPYGLCEDIVQKLNQYEILFKDKTFCVFNLEFAEILMYGYGVESNKIWFVTDCSMKARFARSERYQGINIEEVDFIEYLKEKPKMKFDVVIMNPPYQKPTAGGNGQRDFWPDFVEKAFHILKEDGFLCAIHPAKWRSPTHKLFKELIEKIKYLEIHGEKDGRKTFKCSTRYDWYILKNNNDSSIVKILDENGSFQSIPNDVPFLSNYENGKVLRCIASKGDLRLKVLYSSSTYEPRKPHMSKEKTEEFIYPCVYGMYKDGTFSCQYSKKKEDFFGVSKLILGIGRHLYPLIDLDGKYAMTQNAFAIEVSYGKEAFLLKEAINSKKFKSVIKSTKWGNFQTDYHMFESFKKDFWKEFVDENGNEI